MPAERPWWDTGREGAGAATWISSDARVRTRAHHKYPAYAHPHALQPKVGGGETDPTPATHTRLWRGRRMLPMAMHGHQEEVDSTVPVGAATHEREPVEMKHHCGEPTGQIDRSKCG